MTERRICVLGGAGGIGRGIVSACLANGDYSAAIPLRRIAVVDDIVGPIMFLLGPQSTYMTGQTLWVNGGTYMP